MIKWNEIEVHKDPKDWDKDTVTIPIVCPSCKKEYRLTVPRRNFDMWREGSHVQDAFPNLSPGDRELLISGTCDKCWKEMFGHEESDEGEQS